MTKDFLVVAATPEFALHADIAIAACRAGGVGMIDLGFRRQDFEAHLSRLERFKKRGKTAIRLALHSSSHELPILPCRFDFLVLSSLDLEQASSLLGDAKHYADHVFLEIRSVEEAIFAEKRGFDGVVAKGHEAGGLVGNASSFILAQALSSTIGLPFWLEGGISPNTAAAAMVAGAQGVIYRESLFALKESPFSSEEKERFCALDGSQTVLLGEKGQYFRAFSRASFDAFAAFEKRLAEGQSLAALIEEDMATTQALRPLGQEIAFAGHMARRYGRVGPLVTETLKRVRENVDYALDFKPFVEGSPLALAHHTRYPFVQGPMTRVSDVPSFAKAVVDHGALPFLALALLRAEEVKTLLLETQKQLQEKPWGVGILGFVPAELRREQLEVIQEIKPPFAIIAGGRPSQAKELSDAGIFTYLHVPSAGLLASFLKQGATNFIFEGRECGGHVGPRTSFVLWESAIETLLTSQVKNYETIHILFAGGIHDGQSAAMVAAIAAPLLQKGAKVGVLMGTAYLFTKEAVETGAITEHFQQEALHCEETVLLESGPGHATRCARTPFAVEFENLKKELILKGLSREDIQRELESLNVGRLRIAAKGLDRDASSKTRKLVPVDQKTQHQKGMIMIGDVALITRTVTTMANLHEEMANGHLEWLKKSRLIAPCLQKHSFTEEPIAIVGMAGMFPEAASIREYWHNIIHMKNCIRKVPPEIMDVDVFYDPDPKARDKTYSRWGGFLKDVAFDPLKYGIPPQTIPSIEPTFLIALEVARQALDDAGWQNYPFPNQRTAAIFGLGGMHELGMEYVFRTMLRHYLAKADALPRESLERVQNYLLDQCLPEWTEDAFPGILGNVSAGRIANRLNLSGSNFTVDAACGTSLAALQTAMDQLRLGACDVALAGAMDGTTNVMGFVSFGKTHALSPRGQCRTFDDSADGIAISDGIAALVLKRLSDAERDGDKIYAIIRGMGSSSDGKARSLTAPDKAGQVLALRRAYENAGITPAHVELVEAHGTGTKVGDRVEVTALKEVFGEFKGDRQYCAIGSVKSMIGHTKVAAGMASLIKCTLALEHELLPPTFGVEKPNAFIDFKNSPFYISAETRPWLTANTPRRAGVSAFGFGGTNFHVIVEEYRDAFWQKENYYPHPVEIFLFMGQGKEDFYPLLENLAKAVNLVTAIDSNVNVPHLESLAQARFSEYCKENGPWRLAIIAENYADLLVKIEEARAVLSGHKTKACGVYLGFANTVPTVAFLFPGQGSQRLNMLRELALAYPFIHPSLQLADDMVADRLPQPLSRFIYPIPAFDESEKEEQKIKLYDTMVTQPALGAVNLAAFDLLKAFGVSPHMVAGHSYGEYVALTAAEAMTREDLFRISLSRGQFAKEAAEKNPMIMVAIQADHETVAKAITKLGLPVHIANINSPSQTIVAGTKDTIDQAIALWQNSGLPVKKLAVSTAFHVPEMKEASKKLAKVLESIPFAHPKTPVFSNTLADIYPADAASIRALLARHLIEPVRFIEEINAMYQKGAQVFIEVGPGRVLTNLVNRILDGKDFKALSLEHEERPGLVQFAHLLGEIYSLGVPVHFTHWFANRGFDERSVDAWIRKASVMLNPPKTAWRLKPVKATPWHQPDTVINLKKDLIAPKTSQQAQKNVELAQIKEETLQIPSSNIINAQLNEEKSKAHRLDEMRTHMDSQDLSLQDRQPATTKILEMVQTNLSQFIDLQRGQQRLMERFLDMQERFLSSAQHEGFMPSLPAKMPSFAETHAAAPSRVMPESAPAAAHRPKPAAPTNVAVSEIIKKRAEAQNKVVPAPATVGIPKAAPKPVEPLVPASQDTLENFKENLLRLVSEKTGYPPEMLDLNANLEADLGVDSIKKAEIFGELREHHDALKAGDEEKVLEELSNLRTLNAILDWYQKNTAAQKKSLNA